MTREEPKTRPETTEARSEEDSGTLTVERVGMKLRRWFGRPREADESSLTLEMHPERKSTPATETPGREDLQTAGHPAGLPTESVFVEEDQPSARTPVERTERCREVPILIDLEPEDLEQGVVLKLKISVRHVSDPARQEPSGPRMARAA